MLTTDKLNTITLKQHFIAPFFIYCFNFLSIQYVTIGHVHCYYTH